MKSRIFKRTTAFALLIFTLAGALEPGFVSYAADSYQGQIDAAKKKREELKNKQSDLQKKIDELTSQKEDIEKYIAELDSEYTAIYEEYETTGADIEEAEGKLSETREALSEIKLKEEEQYNEMKLRVKYMYENGEESVLSLFFAGAGAEQIFNQLEYRQQITKYDNILLANYKETQVKIEETEALLTAELESLNALKEYQEDTLSSLEVLSADKAAELEKLAGELGVDEEMLFTYWDEISAADADINKLVKLEEERIAEEERKRKEEEERIRKLKELEASKSIKNIIWPLPGHTRITSYFGYRVAPTKDASTYHKGIDISANTGTDVVAAIAGTVVTATYAYASGNYIVIDHGNGVRTTYCHASKLLVKVGDEVKRGQVIMKVGSTGVSTGPHLHFGIYINGVAVNPLDYVDSSKVLK